MLNNGAVVANRYRLQRLIATGGMGQVWEATDLRLDRRVAVKVLKAEFSADPTFRERFRTEARISAQLNHHGIAGVYDYGETRDPSGAATAYLVMELVQGEPLNAVLGRLGRLSMPHALDMLEQTGRALEVAHAAGVVHRDVKPGNILVTPSGQVKITDFGIAKAVDASPVTKTGMVMGTAQYIAPEQALGQDATAASDVYSLGVVGYEALAGQRPFVGEGALTVAMKHVREAPLPLPTDLPPHVRELVEITMTKDPAARYARGGEFADAVAAVRAGRRPPRPGAAPPAPPPVGTVGLGLGSSPATGSARVRPPTGSTQMLPTSQREYAGPSTGYAPAAVAGAQPPSGLSGGQKALAWGAGSVLLIAALIAGWLIFRPTGGSDAPTAPLVTTEQVVPQETTQDVAPTTTEETTTKETTTTTAPTTTETTTKETTTTTEPTTTQPTTSAEAPVTPAVPPGGVELPRIPGIPGAFRQDDAEDSKSDQWTKDNAERGSAKTEKSTTTSATPAAGQE